MIHHSTRRRSLTAVGCERSFPWCLIWGTHSNNWNTSYFGQVATLPNWAVRRTYRSEAAPRLKYPTGIRSIPIQYRRYWTPLFNRILVPSRSPTSPHAARRKGTKGRDQWYPTVQTLIIVFNWKAKPSAQKQSFQNRRFQVTLKGHSTFDVCYQIKHKASPECPPCFSDSLVSNDPHSGDPKGSLEPKVLRLLIISRWFKIPSGVDKNKVLVSPQFCSSEYFRIRLILI